MKDLAGLERKMSFNMVSSAISSLIAARAELLNAMDNGDSRLNVTLERELKSIDKVIDELKDRMDTMI